MAEMICPPHFLATQFRQGKNALTLTPTFSDYRPAKRCQIIAPSTVPQTTAPTDFPSEKKKKDMTLIFHQASVRQLKFPALTPAPRHALLWCPVAALLTDHIPQHESPLSLILQYNDLLHALAHHTGELADHYFFPAQS